jgi:8-oxo-dGTP pyrophosphatase MutT (NUDIX family)
MPLQNWQLLSSKDVSPSKWFPIEARTYQLPNRAIVKDFTVSKLGNAAMVVPITTDKKVVLVQQFKPGAGKIVIQFPAGRIDQDQEDLSDTAVRELEEETGIKVRVEQLAQFGQMNVASTKSTEQVFFFLAENCEFNSQQHLDKNEEIEIITLTFDELDQKVLSGEISCVQTVAAWLLAKQKFPAKFQ